MRDSTEYGLKKNKKKKQHFFKIIFLSTTHFILYSLPVHTVHTVNSRKTLAHCDKCRAIPSVMGKMCLFYLKKYSRLCKLKFTSHTHSLSDFLK